MKVLLVVNPIFQQKKRLLLTWKLQLLNGAAGASPLQTANSSESRELVVDLKVKKIKLKNKVEKSLRKAETLKGCLRYAGSGQQKCVHSR